MERKRKLPARAARSEASSKKRTSTPPEGRRESPTPAPPPPPVEESLPKNIAPGKPLPTVDEPQPENLSAKEFQSISESGVLAESIQRSKQRWISEGIFEKYWTKPTKKKGIPAELPNNPSKDTMTKLGTCVITVEPHIFDATMYAIKDPNPKPAVTSSPQQPMYRPIIQYGPPNGVMPPAAPPPPTLPVQQKQIPPAQSNSQAPPRCQDALEQHSTEPASTDKDPQTPGSHAHPNRANSSGQATSNAAPQQNPASTNAAPPPTPVQKSSDPVIQMLAERAATDPDLKALMRIVANGEASPDELKKFQAHIDDLSRLSKARQAASQLPAPHNPPPSAPASQVCEQANGRPVQSPVPTQTPRSGPTVPPPQSTSQPQYQPQPQALRSKGPLPSTKPGISGIVFEFAGGSGDRFLFPKFSILEYLPHGQVIASFLIVRKGSSSGSPAYDPALDYYQPITIRLYAHQGRQLEALQKVVAPPDEVRRYMDDIMDNMTRAEYVLLAMRLPKDVEKASSVKEDESEKSSQADHNQVLWATTNPIPPPKVKPAQKLLTEEEKYQSFINSVS